MFFQASVIQYPPLNFSFMPSLNPATKCFPRLLLFITIQTLKRCIRSVVNEDCYVSVKSRAYCIGLTVCWWDIWGRKEQNYGNYFLLHMMMRCYCCMMMMMWSTRSSYRVIDTKLPHYYTGIMNHWVTHLWHRFICYGSMCSKNDSNEIQDKLHQNLYN